MERMLAGLEGWPVNVGLQANARAAHDGPLERARSTPARSASRSTRTTAPTRSSSTTRCASPTRTTSSVSLHTDGLHESAELEDTVAAIAGRTVHAYHVEGTGGGHVPDLLGLVREPNVICSSTTPTIPYGVNAPAEHLPMIDPQPRRVVRRAPATWSSSASASTRRRWRPRDRSTSSARSPSSTPTRRAWAGSGDGPADLPAGPRDQGLAGDRGRTRASGPARRRRRPVRRHRARPALPRQGDDRAGDHPRHRRPRRVAPARPAGRHRPLEAGLLRGQAGVVFKGGYPTWGPLGEGNATVERAEPTRYRPDWGGRPERRAAGGRHVRLGRRRSRRRSRRRLGTRRALVPVERLPRPDPGDRSPGTGRRRRSRSTRSMAG